MIRYCLIFVFFAFVCFADWTQADSDKLNNINNVSMAIDRWWFNYTTGHDRVDGYPDQNMGWQRFFMESYKAQREISDAQEYDFRVVDGVQLPQLSPKNNDAWGQKNSTMFSPEYNMQDNMTYYQDYVIGFFKNNSEITYNNSIPDESFLKYPHYGDAVNKIANKMTSEGFGMDDIINSQQTEPIRGQLEIIEQNVKGVFTDDYTNSVINYDFSEIGNYFVRAGVLNTNPFINLKGQIRIKPAETDYLYSIWHTYFDRSSSVYALALYYGLHTIMFLYFTFFILNDIMSIVNA